jgi:hypothetical protein
MMNKSILSFLILAVSLLVATSCDEEQIDTSGCTTSATVRDLTGLDGCGFVFELEDGSYLEPVRMMVCGTGPLPKEVTEDPLFDFEFVDGKKVTIGYEEIMNRASICMVGKTVRVTCITEADVNSNEF